MDTMDLDKIDLELFKVCFPKAGKPHLSKKKDRILSPCETADRFTQSTEMCFSVLIPEMNRRGWRIKRIMQADDGWYVELVNKSKVPSSVVIELHKELCVAICLAAIKALGVKL